MRIVLASASPARLSLLRGAGVDPLVRVSGIDEHAVTAAMTDHAPAELVTTLAKAKAEAVVAMIAAEVPDAVLIGCDSMLVMAPHQEKPEIVGKPPTAEIAAKRWRQMAGGTGELITGHAVIRLRDGEVEASATADLTTTVRFSDPSDAELNAYIATGEPQKVAGGFTLDGFGGWFIEGVEGDPSSVIGISLPLTRRLLAEVGVSVTELWT